MKAFAFYLALLPLSASVEAPAPEAPPPRTAVWQANVACLTFTPQGNYGVRTVCRILDPELGVLCTLEYSSGASVSCLPWRKPPSERP